MAPATPTKKLNTTVQDTRRRISKEVKSDEKTWELMDIIAHRYIETKLEYQVKWVGYEEASWIPAIRLDEGAMLRRYKAAHGINKSGRGNTRRQSTARRCSIRRRTSLSDLKSDVEEDADEEDPYDVLANAIDCTECPQLFATKKIRDAHLRDDHGWTAKEVKAGEKAYAVEEIVGHRGVAQKLQYQVKWVGYEETTWEPASSVYNGPMLRKYNAAHCIGKAPESSPEPSSSASSTPTIEDKEDDPLVLRSILNHSYDPKKPKNTTFRVMVEPSGDTVTMTEWQLAVIDSCGMEEYLKDNGLIRISDDGTIVKVDCCPCSVCEEYIPIGQIKDHLIDVHGWKPKKLDTCVHALSVEAIVGHMEVGSNIIFKVERTNKTQDSYLSASYFTGTNLKMLLKYAVKQNLQSELLFLNGGEIHVKVVDHRRVEGCIRLLVQWKGFNQQKYWYDFNTLMEIAPRVVLQFWRTLIDPAKIRKPIM